MRQKQIHRDEYARQINELEKCQPSMNTSSSDRHEQEKGLVSGSSMFSSTIWQTNPGSQKSFRDSLIPTEWNVDFQTRRKSIELDKGIRSSDFIHTSPRLPVDDGDWFLIDDGCNLHSSVTKEELEVLKLFKALLSRTTDIGHIANQVLTVGLPNEFRGMVWQLLLGYLPTDANQRNSVLKSQRQTYLTLVEAYCSSFCEDDTELHYLIGMDVLRTHPTCLSNLFSSLYIQNSLRRILLIWSKENPHISYFQGLNDLLTPFMVVFLISRFGERTEFLVSQTTGSNTCYDLIMYLPAIEADSYWCLSKVMNDLQDAITFTRGGVYAEEMMTKFREVMSRLNPSLVGRLDTLKIDFLLFSFRWMLCFLSREVRLDAFHEKFDCPVG
eukprot:TRINITY_DN874_c0_g1_i9.p1 TRINITY_DN874_c0_g1~~TRINITY_DN874_c0_g1_i9.p1  ORF type:complete len:384 (-),score=41.70 TRINITY_DN874_c0_g1_i9:399-1550(-)